MVISIALFVILLVTTFVLKLVYKNVESPKLKRFNEIVELALIVQFLIIVNDIFSIL